MEDCSMTTLALIKSDLTAIRSKSDLLHIILYALFSHDKRALILIRLANRGGVISKVCYHILKNQYFIEANCKDIGPNLRLPHPYGIILSAHKIGENCLIGQYVTLGGNNCKCRMESGKKISTPVIGDNVNILAGTVVAGPIVIGNDVVIGANSTVTFDVEAHTLLYNRPIKSKHKIIVPGYKGAFIKQK